MLELLDSLDATTGGSGSACDSEGARHGVPGHVPGTPSHADRILGWCGGGGG